jgi:hypothetical protein
MARTYLVFGDIEVKVLNADCPKRDGRLTDRCDMVCPDLPTVL